MILELRELRRRLFQEYRRQARVPTISPNSLESDIFAINEKVDQLNLAMQATAVDEHTHHVITSRLAHLEQRVARLGNQVECLIRGIVDYTVQKGARPKIRDNKKITGKEGTVATESTEGGAKPQASVEFLKPKSPEPATETGGPTAASEPSGEVRETFNNLLSMLNREPEAQSTLWSNRDSLGSAASRRSVHFNTSANQGTGQGLMNRTVTPYPRGNINSTEFEFSGWDTGAPGALVGGPNDFVGQQNTPMIPQGILRDHEAVMARRQQSRTEAANSEWVVHLQWKTNMSLLHRNFGILK